MAIATRSALRALPALAAALGPRDGGARRLGRAIVLPVFRANAISFAAAISSRPQADLVIASVSAATSIREASYGFLRSSIPNLSAEDLYALLSARAAIETVAGSVRREFSRRGDIIDHAAHAAGNAADAIRHASGLTHAASWESISADANLINRGTKASELISQPLWPGRNPDWLQEENWDRLKHSLLTLNEGWMVWTEWYEARLEGRLPNEALEIARALIDDEFWQKGPQAISAEIRRLTKKRVSNIKKDSQPLDRPSGARKDEHPQPLQNFPSPFAYRWTREAKIVVASSSVNWPDFSQSTSEEDHHNRLETCRMLAQDLMQELRAGIAKIQARLEYLEGLAKYVARLPHEPGSGNILLADAAARTLRNFFAAEYQELSAPFASQLKTLPEHHIGLRVFYPEIGRFYRDVRSGKIESPLPEDAVDGVAKVVDAYTPDIFDASVGESIEEGSSVTPAPALASSAYQPSPSVETPTPPKDPLGEVDPQQAHDVARAGIVNALYKAFLEGEKISKAKDAWTKISSDLLPYVKKVIDWLEPFRGPGDGGPPIPPMSV